MVHKESETLEEYIEFIGELEGSPDYIVDQAKCYGRTLLFHTSPAMRCSPAEARNRAADWLRRRTCRTD